MPRVIGCQTASMRWKLCRFRCNQKQRRQARPQRASRNRTPHDLKLPALQEDRFEMAFGFCLPSAMRCRW